VKTSRIEKDCPQCRGRFTVKASLDRIIHCSKECAMIGGDGRFKKGQPSPRKKAWIEKECPECCVKFAVKPSLSHIACCSISCAGIARRGKPGPNVGRKFGPSAKRGIPLSEETKAKLRAALVQVFGPAHHNWRGGNRSIRKQEMSRYEYREWRASVFKRDDFTCRECGIRGAALHADHIKPWSTHPEHRFDLANGRTLCVPCHCKTESFPKQLVPKELRI
jgi:5-methylcytosine-specific restriction endonuclease McrA